MGLAPVWLYAFELNKLLQHRRVPKGLILQGAKKPCKWRALNFSDIGQYLTESSFKWTKDFKYFKDIGFNHVDLKA